VTGIQIKKSFSTELADCRSVKIVLRALAAQKMLRERKFLRRYTA
jgi:hypothetical protein